MLPTRFGDFRLQAFADRRKAPSMPRWIRGHPSNGCLVRLHSECATGDILGSLRLRLPRPA